MNFAGKTASITGATTGIGCAAGSFLEQGAKASITTGQDESSPETIRADPAWQGTSATAIRWRADHIEKSVHFGTPSEIAGAVSFLVSDASSCMSDTEVVVGDGSSSL